MGFILFALCQVNRDPEVHALMAVAAQRLNLKLHTVGSLSLFRSSVDRNILFCRRENDPGVCFACSPPPGPCWSYSFTISDWIGGDVIFPGSIAPGPPGVELYGPTDIEVHRGRDGRFYVLDTARVFPPLPVAPDRACEERFPLWSVMKASHRLCAGTSILHPHFPLVQNKWLVSVCPRNHLP